MRFFPMALLLVSLGLVFSISGPVVSASSHATLSPEIKFLLSRGINPTVDVFGPEGIAPAPTATADPLVGVLIRTRSVGALRGRGVRVNSVMGDVVSAKVTLGQLEQMAQWPEVVYVEGPGSLSLTAQIEQISQPELVQSVPLTGARRLHHQGIRGEGVVIGVVDTGVDWTHLDFRMDRDEDGTGFEEGSRILGIWDQTHVGDRPDGFDYGTEYTQALIEAAIRAEDPGQLPHFDANPNAPSHGTQALSIAGGDGSSSSLNLIGMAPRADLVAVKSPLTFNTVIDGINYIFAKAGDRPAVASLSLGSHLGAHDGTGNFERALDALATQPGRVIVLSAGNEGDDNIHVGGALSSTAKTAFTFDIPRNNALSRYTFDFWYDFHTDGPLEVRVIGPDGQGLGPISTGEITDESTTSGGIFIDNASGGPNPNNGDNELLVTVYGKLLGAKNELLPGRWTIEIHAPRLGFRYDGWALELPFSSLNADNDATVRIPATAQNVIAVGAFVSRTSWIGLDGRTHQFVDDNDVGQIAAYSSLGPTRDGRTKPDLVAPGSMIASALSKDSLNLVDFNYVLSDGVHAVNRGTSFAAPHVAGAAALLLQQNPGLNTPRVMAQLQQHALRDPFTGFGSNNTSGSGKLDLNFEKPETPEGLSLVTFLDEDQNHVLDDNEILTAIQTWVMGGVLSAQDNVIIDDEAIVWLVQLWIQQTDLSALNVE